MPSHHKPHADPIEGRSPGTMVRDADTRAMTTHSSRLALATVAAATLLFLSACSTPAPLPAGQRSALACTLPSNCVDSVGTDGPAPLKFSGTPQQALARLESTLKTFAEAQVVHREALAVQVIFTTSMGFRDQVDFQIDPAAQRIDFRSRSLFGLFDFGKNRSRMQAFAQRFQAPT